VPTYESLLAAIRENVLTVLGLPIDSQDYDDTGFFELGMDSLMAVGLGRRIKKIIPNIEIGTTVVFDYPTIVKLTNYIEAQLTGKTQVKERIINRTINDNEPIAIIGLSCRFPGGANSPEQFWQLLEQSYDGGIEIPISRWNMDTYYDPDPDKPGKIYARRAGLINIPMQEFDAGFFNITPKEAEFLDPQHRILLEQTWLALENAAICPSDLKESATSVFLGLCSQDYLDLLRHSDAVTGIDSYAGTGNSASTAAGHISYIFGLQAASMVIDTACSSSLVAIHEACQSLRNGESDLAISGGVNAILSPDFMATLCRMHMLSPTESCKTFDKYADGFMRGEGCGIVILKRLNDAQRDGDRILAVISGAAINQDGATSGLTVPNGPAQQRVIKEALQRAQLTPDDIDYIEAHGTGTALGDPIEVNALAQVFTINENNKRQQPLILGSVKSNIGHLEAAAGVAGLIKTILCLQHHKIAPHIHFESINPAINLEAIPAQLPLQAISWERKEDRIRRAGISSFGFSGTNIHLIIEEAPLDANIIPIEIQQLINDQQHCLFISAKTEQALLQQIQHYLYFLKSTTDAIQDICYTSQIGRTHFEHQVLVKGKNIAELIAKINAQDYLIEKKLVNKSEYSDVIKPYLRKVSLPTYIFQRQNYWPNVLKKSHLATPALNGVALSGLLGHQLRSPGLDKIVFESIITAQHPEFIKDHHIYDVAVIAGGAFISLILSALRSINSHGRYEIEDITFEEAMIVEANKAYTLQLIMEPLKEKSYRAKIVSREISTDDSSWIFHAQAVASIEDTMLISADDSFSSLENQFASGIFFDQESHHRKVKEHGLQLQSSFLWISQGWLLDNKILIHFRAAENSQEEQDYVLHPGLIDAIFQGSLYAAHIDKNKNATTTYVPFSVKRFSYSSAAHRINDAVITIMPSEQHNINAGFQLYDESGECVGVIEGFVAHEAPQEKLLRAIHHEPAVEDLLYQVMWKPTELVTEKLASAESWLIVGEKNELTDFLSDYLIQQRQTVLQVNTLKAINNNDLKQRAPSRLIWIIPALDSNDGETIKRAQHELADSLLQFAYLEQYQFTIYCVTFGAQDETSSDLIAASLSALIPTLAIEYSQWLWYQIDLPKYTIASEQGKLLLSALLQSQEKRVARINDCWYAPRVLPYKKKGDISPVFDETGTYLITGGYGALGLVLMDYLVNQGVKEFIVVGRNVVLEQAQQQLEIFTSKGVIIHIWQCDVGEREQIQQLFARIKEEHISLKGIFHLAGILNDGLLKEQTLASFDQVFASKALGAWYLHEYSQSYLLTHFVMFSSVASVIGSAGQTNYVFANGFLDALSHFRNQNQLPAIAINWGPWKQSGMAVNLTQRLLAQGLKSLSTSLGKKAFDIVLAELHPQLMVLSIDWSAYGKYLNTVPSWLSDVVKENAATGYLVKLLQLAPQNKQLGQLHQQIKQIVKDVLGLSHSQSVDEERGFFDIGMDSLMLLALRRQLKNALGNNYNLTAADIFNHASINQLTTYLTDLLKINQIVPKNSVSSEIIATNESIAIVGMSCRLPGGANSPQHYWDLLLQGFDGISEIPKDRWDINEYFDADPNALGKMYTRSGGFLQDIDIAQFDAEFFGISPRETEIMDPQHRLLLEVSWEAFENAGYTINSLSGSKTGVFVGISTHDYGDLLEKAGISETVNSYFGTGNSHSAAIGRLSYLFGLQGPNMAIDTACSSSLLAIHLACQSLHSGESDLAIAGGVNLMINPNLTLYFCKSHMLAADGHCKTFDKSADGYVRGEGCGIIVLKRLSDAQRDGDNILGLVKGTATNQDGMSGGLTVPNGVAQQAVIEQALTNAKLNAADIDHIEVHGTGTRLGDPIEAQALAKVFGQHRKYQNPLLISSVKTNIGHLEAAAGIAGIIKLILSLQHEIIPPHRNFKEINPAINLDEIPARIPLEATPWPRNERIRRAGISGFSFSGSNVHVVIEEAPEVKLKTVPIELLQKQHLLLISAKSDAALTQNVQHYLDYLKRVSSISIEDICYTSQVARNRFEKQVAVIGSSLAELIQKLETGDYLSAEKIANYSYTELSKNYFHKVSLPTYPFQRQYYWANILRQVNHKNQLGEEIHPLLGIHLPAVANQSTLVFEKTLNLKDTDLSYLKDHTVFNHIVFPGAGYIELALASLAYQENTLQMLKLSEISIESPLLLSDLDSITVQVLIHQTREIEIYSKQGVNDWHLHMRAKGSLTAPVFEMYNLEALRSQMTTEVDIQQLYQRFTANGIDYGSNFQTIQSLHSTGTEAIAAINVKENNDNRYHAYPTLLDGVFQVLAWLIEEKYDLHATYLPIGADVINLYSGLGASCIAYVKLVGKGTDTITADLILFTQSGQVLMTVAGLKAKRAAKVAFEKLITDRKNIQDWCYIPVWENYEPNVDNKINDEGFIYYDARSPSAEVISSDSANKLLTFIQSIIATNQPVKALIIITHQAYSINGEAILLNQAVLNGFIKTAILEHPELNIRQMDIAVDEILEPLLAFISKEISNEKILAYRENHWYVARIKKERDANEVLQRLSIPLDEYRLIKDTSGMLEHLHLVKSESSELKADEIMLAPRAVGLNFRDVLNAMNLYPGDAGDLGADCAGVIIAVGDTVTDYKVGDEVMGISFGSLASSTITKTALITHKPIMLNFTQAASIPTIYMTSYLALVKVAQLKADETVLIHAGAGGVGLAAIQIAQYLNATIIATAGSEQKRAYLRQLGVHHVFDSRSLTFQEEIMKVTQGQGVNVVLNSLSGNGYIEATLASCASNARFIEIGKRDIWSHDAVKAVRNDVSYDILALDQLAEENPTEINSLLNEVMHLFNKNILIPLPCTIFALSDATQAFHYLQQAKQIGKVVIELPEVGNLFEEKANYIITGGLGGIGLELANYLAEHGAKKITLVSRNQPSDKAKAAISALQSKGIDIIIYHADVTDKYQIEQLINETHSKKHPLKGVFHAAGVIDDAPIDKQTEQRFKNVFAAKAQGAWYLHEITVVKHIVLDYFVLFSSIASLNGSPAQSNYAAANSFLDALAHYRHLHDLCAQAINWGPWRDVGMAKDLIANHERQGLKPFTSKEGLQALTYGLKQNYFQLSLVNCHWKLFGDSLIQIPSWLCKLVDKEETITFIEQLQNVPKEQREALLKNTIIHELRKVLGLMSHQTIDELKGFFELGMDSLMSLELKNRLQNIFGQSYSNTLLFDYPTVDKLMAFIADRLDIKKLPFKINSPVEPHNFNEPIAIIGMSCRFPGGANSINDFWQLLKQGFNASSEVPKNRWDIDAYYDPNPDAAGKIITRNGGFLTVPIDTFDAGFFKISPREAEYLDPQQRLLLEVSVEALENAGILPDSLRDTDTGVFIGISSHDYGNLLGKYLNDQEIKPYFGTGNAASTATGRISYTFGLKGPSLAIDTACSSSLVALHQACQSLHNGESDLVITGGVNVLLAPELSIDFSQAHMLSPDGHCKTFDASADGYLRGEGCGIIILKRLSAAQRDHDRILAVIKSSAVNQDGASSGLTVPNGPSQEILITNALARAKLYPHDIDYIEAHGTGTSLGDPIEVNALQNVFGKERERVLTIGTVKTNIGHLEAAAGIAGLIKTVLSLQNEEIPRHLHFKTLNPTINLDAIPAQFPLQPIEWKRGDRLRRAGVSSFGFSGTNAHVILEEAPLQNKMQLKLDLPKTIFNRQRYWARCLDERQPELASSQENAILEQDNSLTNSILERDNLSYNDILQVVREQVLNVLYLPTSDLSKDEIGFFELGIDSLMAAELKSRFTNLFPKLNLSSTAVFDYPTIVGLSNYITAQLSGEILTHEIDDSVVSQDPIAVIGLSCRLPGGANSPQQFWELLSQGFDGGIDIPLQRWDMSEYFSEDSTQHGKIYTKRAGLLNVPLDEFDAKFFGISPREAMLLDPQQRLLLEVTWEGLEYAHINPQNLYNSLTGVFIGIYSTDYRDMLNKHAGSEAIDSYVATGTAGSTAAGRISYTLGLRGPNFAIDTACSSSLVAVHQACQSLRQGECHLAIAGGVNTILSPEAMALECSMSMLSPAGKCKTFDINADGFMRAEGCGVVILKRLSDAQRDGDEIIAVIKGSAINQDGASSGLTVPNGPAQEEVIWRALKQAGLKPDDIDYIEAHGTGTRVGDPIEINAIEQVFGVEQKSNQRKEPLVIGTVKTNIGHAEAASGIAGLIKTILSLQHQKIPRHLHFTELNPALSHLSMIPAKLPLQEIIWEKSPGHTRRAGISSFAFSGSNAHVIIEEPPAYQLSNIPAEINETLHNNYHLLVISAKTDEALNQYSQLFISHLEHTTENIYDICYTSQIAKAKLTKQIYVIGKTIDELIANLAKHNTLDEEESQVYYYDEKLHHHFKKTVLPSYPFQREHYWFNKVNSQSIVLETGIHPLLQRKLDLPGSQDIYYESMIDKNFPDFIKDHVIYDQIIIAGAAYISMSLSLIKEHFHGQFFNIVNVEFIEPLIISQQNISTRLVIKVTSIKDSRSSIEIYSQLMPQHDLLLHAKMELDFSNSVVMISKLAQIKSEFSDKNALPNLDIINEISKFNLKLGPHFQWISNFVVKKDEILAELRWANEPIETKGYVLYPGLIDSIFQTLLPIIKDNVKKLMVPFSIEKFSINVTDNAPKWIHGHIVESNQQSICADFSLFDSDGLQIGHIKGFVMREIQRGTMEHLLKRHDKTIDYFYETVWEESVLLNENETVEQVENNKNIIIYDARENTIEMVTVSPVIRLLDFIQNLLIEDDHIAQLNIITEQAYHVNHDACTKDQKDPINLNQAMLNGFIKTAILENPELNIRQVDIEKNIIFNNKLLSQLPAKESIFVLRNDRCYVPRIASSKAIARDQGKLAIANYPYWRLEQEILGDLNSLHIVPCEKEELLPDEVEILVTAVGLNFRDVLIALDLYPGISSSFGADCAGVVTRLGEKVTAFTIGDKVFGIVKDAFRAHVVTNEKLLVKLPEHLSSIEGASLPVIMLTAYYSLYHLIKLKPKVKILIHTGAGGVGLMAIQLAQLAGAIVYTTASTEKQNYLKEQGIDYVYDSRTINFSQEILKDTEGQGVDIVLNTLTGEGFKEATLACLRKDGVFIEISKRNIYEPQAMRTLRPDVEYHIVAIDNMLISAPEVLQSLLLEIVILLKDQTITPPVITTYNLNELSDAMQYMQQGKNIGKVVIEFPNNQMQLQKNASYLITGGLGGIGLEVARYLVKQGAMRIILASRSSPNTKMTAVILNLQQQGIDVVHHQIDISDKQAVETLINAVHSSDYPLKGIFHAAGLIEDAPLNKQTAISFEKIFAPKAKGAWHLHEITLAKDIKLDYFVLFSSIASLIGSSAQGNYAVANSFLDALALYRHQLGLVAQAINWGPWAEVGMAKDLVSQHYRQGWVAFNVSEGLSAFHHALLNNKPQLGIMHADWKRIGEQIIPTPSWLSHLIEIKQSENFIIQLQALSLDQRKIVLKNAITDAVKKSLAIPKQEFISENQGFFEMGMDSLMALDLKNRIQQLVNQPLLNTLAFDYPSILRIYNYLSTEIMEDLFENSAKDKINEENIDKFLSMNFLDREKFISGEQDHE